ncbi:MAG: hypothetical protein AAF511_00170 [Pseudomonadota bacterium]
MKLTTRFWTMLVGTFLVLVIFLVTVRSVDDIDPMLAAIVWTIGGLVLSATLIRAAITRRKKPHQHDHDHGHDERGDHELDID